MPDRAFVAFLEGAVVGIAGFKIAGKGLFEPSLKTFVHEYGLSSPFRHLGLALLERREPGTCLLMDGIAVAGQMRGKGIGSRLISAVEDYAIRSGKNSIRLDVVDTNPNARRLYERIG